MNMQSTGTDLIRVALDSYLPQLPMLLVWLVGLILAAALSHRQPSVSALTGVALIVLLAESVLGTYFNTWLPTRLAEQGLNPEDIDAVLGVVSLLENLVRAGAWTLLLAAIFGWPRSREV